MKQCRQCNETKPVAEFNKSSKGCSLGLHSYCIPCQKIASAESYQRNKARKKAEYEAWKEADPEAVKTYHRARTIKYAEKNKVLRQKRYAEHKARILADARARYPKYREANLAYLREWRATRHKGWFKAYYEKKRSEILARNSHKRAKKLQATPSWADDLLIREFYETADALNMWTGEWHHVDHIVPLNGKTVRGFHSHHNLQILTATENFKKNNLFWPDQP